MEFESVENIDKSEFLPLGTVKQEMLDTANVIDEDVSIEGTSENSEINNATTNRRASDASETNNPVCDSAEKQVKTSAIFFHSNILLWLKTPKYRLKIGYFCSQIDFICIENPVKVQFHNNYIN